MTGPIAGAETRSSGCPQPLAMLARSLADGIGSQALVARLPETVANCLGAKGAVVYLSKTPSGQLTCLGRWGDAAAAAPDRASELPPDVALAPVGPPHLVERTAETWPTGRMLVLPLVTATGHPGGVLALDPDPSLDLTWLTTEGPGLAAVIGLALGWADAESQSRLQHETAVAVQRISDRAAKQMAVLPERHLWAAVQRGFRVWPDTSTRGMPEFLQPLLQTLVEEARGLAGAEIAALGIGDDPSRPFLPWVFAGVSESVAAAVGRGPRPVGVLGVVAREGKTVRLREVQDHPAFRGFPAHHPEVHSLLGIPVRYRDRPLGTLYLGNKVGADEFSEEDERLVGSILPAITLGLQQTYLQAAAVAQRSQLESLLESAPVAILFIDAGSGQVMANPSAMELFGHSLVPEYGREQYMPQLSLPDGSPLVELHGDQALSSARPISRELIVRRMDGSEVAVLETQAPVMGWQDHVLGVVVVFQDVSPLRELNKLREEFAALAAYDLRGPLESMLMEAQTVLAQLPAPPMAPLLSWVNAIRRTLEQLTALACDLQDAAAIELGRISLFPQPVDLTALVQEALGRHHAELSAHPIVMHPAGSPAPIALDRRRTVQALGKLLQNAARRSPEGAPIEVTVSVSPNAQVVAVRDHGPRPTPEEVPKLFDRYYEAQQSRRQTGRVWLGLYIAKGLVESFGGQVSAEPGPDEGCTVVARFPQPQVNLQAA